MRYLKLCPEERLCPEAIYVSSDSEEDDVDDENIEQSGDPRSKKKINMDKFSDRLSAFIDGTSTFKQGHSLVQFPNNEPNIAAYGWYLLPHTSDVYILTNNLSRAADAAVFEQVNAAGNAHRKLDQTFYACLNEVKHTIGMIDIEFTEETIEDVLTVLEYSSKYLPRILHMIRVSDIDAKHCSLSPWAD